MEIRKLEPIAQKARAMLRKSTREKLHAIVSNPNHDYWRTKNAAATQLLQKYNELGEETLVDRVAYSWFNRFTALMYMDVRSYNPLRVVSSNENETQIEILLQAEMGVYDDRLTSPKIQQEVREMFAEPNSTSGKYKDILTRLIVGACNAYAESMPFLFQKVDDYSELLLPDDLVSDDSILALIHAAINEQSVETLGVSLIGWLYQFYISERKDEVIGKVVNTADIPAATQLFTPEWIVRYLVDNTLGRAWLENNPDDDLQAKMEYYIPGQEPTAQELSTDVTKIRFLDPCCGSGHILVYAFDLFAQIYTRLGYAKTDIPRLILQNNLVGLELDARAAGLASFALVLKAMEYDRRFLSRANAPLPNVTQIKKVSFRNDAEQINALAQRLANKENSKEQILDLFTLFENADAVGSLIVPEQTVDALEKLQNQYQVHKEDFELFFNDRIDTLFRQAILLADRYDVVVTNPPYMGNSYMNPVVKNFIQENYPDYKYDLFSAFVLRNCQLTVSGGYLGFMTPFVWMFISSYESLRRYVIEQKTITSLIQLEYSGFEGATVPICTYTLCNRPIPEYKGAYIRLSDFRGADNQSPKTLEAIRNPSCGWFYQTDSSDFEKIPGSPIAYWVSDRVFKAFEKCKLLTEIAHPRKGLATTDNNRFLRLWHEVSQSSMCTNCRSKEEAINSRKKWFPLNKGGNYRRWYGNKEFLVNWFNDGIEMKNAIIERYQGGSYTKEIRSEHTYFKQSITWSALTAGKSSFRFSDFGSIFDSAGSSMFPEIDYQIILCLLNSNVTDCILTILNPTLNYGAGTVGNVPVLFDDSIKQKTYINAETLISLSRRDWDSYETSWDFECNPLVTLAKERGTQSVLISDLYQRLREQWRADTLEMKRLEEENNRIFIEAYGLQDELSPEVPLSEVSLTCNPAYRYKSDNAEQNEQRLEQDAVKELLSYAVGCMMGRYCLDKPGLILADQESTEADYRAKTGSDYPVDPDGIIPLYDDDFMPDDVVKQLHEFLKRAFGEATLSQNMSYMETILGKDLRKYFQKDFFADHVQTYKKRPVYWLFTSPKGGFACLAYMHRYFNGTCSLLLNRYLRLYKTKLEQDKQTLENELANNAAMSAGEKNAHIKNVDRISKLLLEIGKYERDELNPLAGERIELDLDDGVKVNYVKFYPAVKKVI